MTEETRSERRWLPAAIIAAVTLLCFGRSVLQNDFVNWDDDSNLTENQSFRGLSPERISWMFSEFHEGHYQPVTWVSFAIDYEIWGMDPVGYHLTNLLLHTANAILFYLLLLLLLRGREETPSSVIRWAACAAALFFAIHPLRVESVAWATERRDMLSTFFLLLTVIFYLKASEQDGRIKWVVLSILCYTLSLLSKAWGMTLPLVLIVIDVWPLKRFSIRTLIAKIPFAVLAMATAVTAAFAQNQVSAVISIYDHTPMERVIQAGYGIWFYVSRTVVPVFLSPLYELDAEIGLSDPKYLIAIAAVLGITVAVILLRKLLPALLVAWVCYIIIVSPVLGFLQSGAQLVADRYSYVSTMPMAALVAGAFVLWRLKSLIGIAIAALGFYGVLTFYQSGIWKDSITLWNHVLELDKDSIIAYLHRGKAKMEKGDYDGAVEDLDEAIQRHPMSHELYNNRGLLHLDRREYELAEADFTKVILLQDQHPEAHANRASARMKLTRFDEALEDIDRAIELKPDTAKFFIIRCEIHYRWSRYDAAVMDADKAIELDSLLSDAWHMRGITREAQGKLDDAMSDLNRAVALAPLAGRHLVSRSKLRLRRGNRTGALEDVAEAIRVEPGYAESYWYRAQVRHQSGNVQGMVEDASQVIRLRPEFKEAYLKRGAGLVGLQRFDEAMADFNTALQLDPEYAAAFYNRGLLWKIRGNFDQAIEDCEKALEVAPPDWPFRNPVGEVLRELRNR